MKKLVIVLLMLVVAAGCATSRIPEPQAPVTPITETTPSPVSEATVSTMVQKAPISALSPTTVNTPSTPLQQTSAEPGNQAQPAAPETVSEIAASGEKQVAPESLSTGSGTQRAPETAPESEPLSEDTVSGAKQTAPAASAAGPGHSGTTVRKRRRTPSPSREEGPVPEHKLQPLTDLAATNDSKLMHVYVGMYRIVVERYMGSPHHNPYRRTSITGSDGQVYEVFFYLTREPRKGRIVTDRMLTPVIFAKDVVAGIGYYKLRKLISTGTLSRRKADVQLPKFPPIPSP